MIVGKPQLLKNLNSDIVRDFIYREGPVSKPEIAVGTALSLPTVKKRVDLLLREGWIRETGRSGEGVGRKAVKYEADRSHNMILLLYKRGGFWAYLVDLTGRSAMSASTATKRAAPAVTWNFCAAVSGS